ncbi:MAG: hypothetical protein Q9169_000003 [Polycauliona sp. 2 TL-2023]
MFAMGVVTSLENAPAQKPTPSSSETGRYLVDPPRARRRLWRQEEEEGIGNGLGRIWTDTSVEAKKTTLIRVYLSCSILQGSIFPLGGSRPALSQRPLNL